MTGKPFTVGSVGLERVQMEAPSEGTATPRPSPDTSDPISDEMIKGLRPSLDLGRMEAPAAEHTATIRAPRSSSAPLSVGGIKGLVPSPAGSIEPVPFVSPRSARYKIVCSYQNFFEQQKSSSSSVVHFLVGQELEFKLVDTTRGDEEVLPFDAWKWTLVRGSGSGKASRTFSGSGSFLRTNDLELGEWTLIASCRSRNESCSIRLIGDSYGDWKIFAPLMPKARTDPDAYASRLSACLEIDKEGKSCGGAADPSDGNELATVGGDAEIVLERLESRLAKTEGLKRYPIQAMYTQNSTMRNYALRVFLSVVDGKWMITDWTLPEVQGKTGWFWGGMYTGEGAADKEAILKAFKAWEDGNRYATGDVHWRTLTPADQFELKGSFHTSGTTDIDEWSEGLQWTGTGFLAVSVVPTAQTKAIGGIGASICFGTSAGLNFYQRTSQGFATRHDLLENGMDLAMVALSMLGLTRAAGGALARFGPEKLKVFAEGAETLFLHGQKAAKLAQFEERAGKVLLLVCGVQAIESAWAITRRKDLSSSEKYHALVESLGLFALQGLLTVVSRRTDKFVKVPPPAAKAPPPPETSGKTGNPPAEGGKPLEGEQRTLKYEGEKPPDAEGQSASGNTGDQASKVEQKEAENNLDEIHGESSSERHETVVSRKLPDSKGNRHQESRPGDPKEKPNEEPLEGERRLPLPPRPAKAWRLLEKRPGGTLKGVKTKVDPKEGPEKQYGHRKENESAVVVQEHGYHVLQNPGKRINGKKPDYFLHEPDGREIGYTDCVSAYKDPTPLAATAKNKV